MTRQLKLTRRRVALQAVTSMKHHEIEIPKEHLADFCHRHHIRKLSLFGSILRDDFNPESDIDVLVEFEPEHTPGFFRLANIERELAALVKDPRVDLCTPQELSHYFRNEVEDLAEVQYEQEG
jgi:hypothetical protein